MLYAWIGRLKPETDVPQSVQQQTTDFLAQPLIEIRYAGPLRDASGQRAGMLMIFERNDRESAEKFVANSPYLLAGLYEEDGLYEYANEVG
jgi:uncharacterized protein YciI